MTSPFGPRGLYDALRLTAIAPRVTRVTQRFPASSAAHSGNHILNRRATLAASNLRNTSRTIAARPSTVNYHIGAGSQVDEGQQSRRRRRGTEHKRSLGVDCKPLQHAKTSTHWSLASAQASRSTLQRCSRRTLPQTTIGQAIRWRSDVTKRKDGAVPVTTQKPKQDPRSESNPEPSASNQDHFYDRFHLPNFQNFHRPSMPQFHRPTKEELLAAATGFWSRLRIRFKWSTIRSLRPFNIDEITGFISWILLGHVIWLVIGTTTFVSLAILAINTVFAQETLAGWVGNYLTKSSGLKVVFESAVVPRWGDGVITFKNVFVSRRPGEETKSGVTKGSAEAAAIAAAQSDEISAENQNYTQFDITLGEVNVTLSFRKWWNSKGLLQNVEIKHVRGVVDRTHVFWTGEEVDPKSYRHEHNPGDFEIDSFKIEDLLVSVHQPKGFRPFQVSIYNGDLPRLRKQWMFYDFLSANSMTGEFDRSLFTIHPRQVHSYTGAQLNEDDHAANDPWKKQSRIRVDGLHIDHLNRGVEGPFSWIHEGNVDIIADIMIPNDNDESVMKVMSDFYERLEATLTSRKHLEPQVYNAEDAEALGAAQGSNVDHRDRKDDDKRFMVMDLRVHLNDVRAVVPLFTRELSYVKNALIRPIVAYINSRRTFIPINCRVVKRASDFDGSWTVFDSGLLDDLSAEVYEAFARDVTDEQARLRRFKKVGLWGVQLAVQAIFMGMAGNIA